MHWDTFKQGNYNTVGGDGDVGSARYEPALLPSCPIRVLSYSNCQRSTHSHFYVNFQKFSTLKVNTVPFLCFQSDSFSDLSSDNSSTGGGSISHRFSVPTFPSASYTSLAALTTSPYQPTTSSSSAYKVTSPVPSYHASGVNRPFFVCLFVYRE